MQHDNEANHPHERLDLDPGAAYVFPGLTLGDTLAVKTHDPDEEVYRVIVGEVVELTPRVQTVEMTNVRGWWWHADQPDDVRDIDLQDDTDVPEDHPVTVTVITEAGWWFVCAGLDQDFDPNAWREAVVSYGWMIDSKVAKPVDIQGLLP